MEKLELKVSGMSCGHCVAAVSKSLNALDGVDVENVEIGSVKVSYDPASLSRDRIAEAVADAGFEVVG